MNEGVRNVSPHLILRETPVQRQFVLLMVQILMLLFGREDRSDEREGAQPPAPGPTGVGHGWTHRTTVVAEDGNDYLAPVGGRVQS